jgi:hypothetical protein
MLVLISFCFSYCTVRGAGAADALAASPVSLVSFFPEHLLQLSMLQRWQFFSDLAKSDSYFVF